MISTTNKMYIQDIKIFISCIHEEIHLEIIVYHIS